MRLHGERVGIPRQQEPVGSLREDKKAYMQWLETTIEKAEPIEKRSHGFRYRGQYQEQIPEALEIAEERLAARQVRRVTRLARTKDKEIEMATLTLPIEEKKKGTEQEALITGSEAIAVACKLADVDVVTAYPIRPYDTVMQYISQLVADGEMDCEYIVAEGEHSQFEIVKHASVCGARVFCGSSGVGWMYAMEC